MAKSSVKETREERRARLAWRRVRQLERTPGFTAVPNRRVNGAIRSRLMMLISMGMNPVEADVQARRDVARTLQPRPLERSYNNRPGKSYRAEATA